MTGVATDIASRMAAAAGDLSSRMAGQFPNMVAATQTPAPVPRVAVQQLYTTRLIKLLSTATTQLSTTVSTTSTTLSTTVKSTTPPPTTTTTTTTTTSTTTTWLSTTTTTPLAPTPAGESHFFLFIGLFILFSILFVGFALVGLALKTRWDRYRHHMMPLYQFDPDQDDLEAELLESPERSRLDTSRSRRDFGTCQKAAPPPPQLDLMN